MMKKILKTMMMTLLLCFALSMIPVSAKASTLIPLDQNKTYSSYDFTRDGKRDKFKYTSNYSTGYTKIYLNGKYKQQIFSAKGGILYWCKFSQKDTFLLQEYTCFGGHELVAYKYSNGKFKEVKTFTTAIFPYCGYAKVKGNVLYLQSSCRSFNTKSFDKMGGSGMLSCTTKYKLSKGNFSLLSRRTVAAGERTFYARQAFKTSASENSLSKKNGPSVKKGQKVTLQRIYFMKDGNLAYKIKVGSKFGWFKDSASIKLYTK